VERVWYAEQATPVGTLGVAAGERGIVRIVLPNELGLEKLAELEVLADDGRSSEAVRQLGEYFAGERKTFELELDPRGTPFQRAVWREVAGIPYGQTTTYGELARRLGEPNAHRAVGAANGDNPLPIVVPCHRVIGSNGQLTGYAGGTAMKAFLLGLEGVLPRDGEDPMAWAERRGAEQPSLLIGPRSTRIFCRPTCRYSRQLRHVPRLFGSSAEAIAQGYRACRVCQPV
jgi:methylated-DNA-[protein]-cysteine S-methyltransferase